MITIIAGSRNYPAHFKKHHLCWLDLFKTEIPITKVIAGGCHGVDKNAILWAKSMNIPFEEFPADWSRGKKAGYERNLAMAKIAEAVILFPGGKGTDLMHRIAVQQDLKIYIMPA